MTGYAHSQLTWTPCCDHGIKSRKSRSATSLTAQRYEKTHHLHFQYHGLNLENDESRARDPKQDKVVVNELPVPEPAPNEILVKITSASLCHSDIMSIERPGLEEPFTLGHEGVGYHRQIAPFRRRQRLQLGRCNWLPVHCRVLLRV